MAERQKTPPAYEAAYPVPAEKRVEFERFLHDKVGALTRLRGNYGPHTDPVRVLSASTLSLALELVYPSPPEKDPAFERQRNLAIRGAVDRTTPQLDPHSEPYHIPDEEAAALELIDPHLPYAVEIIEKMHQLGLDEDIYNASLKSLVSLAKDTDFFLPY